MIFIKKKISEKRAKRKKKKKAELTALLMKTNCRKPKAIAWEGEDLRALTTISEMLFRATVDTKGGD